MRAALTAFVALALALPGSAAQKQILSRVYTVDRKYRSMEGPSSVEKITLGPDGSARTEPMDPA